MFCSNRVHSLAFKRPNGHLADVLFLLFKSHHYSFLPHSMELVAQIFIQQGTSKRIIYYHTLRVLDCWPCIYKPSNDRRNDVRVLAVKWKCFGDG